jgi:hypothetical protein
VGPERAVGIVVILELYEVVQTEQLQYLVLFLGVVLLVELEV